MIEVNIYIFIQILKLLLFWTLWPLGLILNINPKNNPLSNVVPNVYCQNIINTQRKVCPIYIRMWCTISFYFRSKITMAGIPDRHCFQLSDCGWRAMKWKWDTLRSLGMPWEEPRKCLEASWLFFSRNPLV